MQTGDTRTAYDPDNVVRSITIEIDAPASIVWDQAENRMHAEKAVLYLTLA